MRKGDGPRIAPIDWASNAGQAREKHWWNGLTCAMVPFDCGGAATGGAPAVLGGHAYDLVRMQSPSNDGGVVIRGEQSGPAMRFISGPGMTFPVDTIPRLPPVSAFAFLIRRHSSAIGNVLIGNGYLGGGGYTLQLDYGSGQLGITKWGVSDNPTTVLGGIPVGVESAVGYAWGGGVCRFMLNGKFEQLTLSDTSTVANSIGYGCYANFTDGLDEMAIYVTYVWNRVLSDEMMSALVADPWRVIRPYARTRHRVPGIANVSTRRRHAAIVGG